MQDHSIEIQLFFFGSAILSGLEAMKAEKWRVYALWALTGLFVACGALWSYVREISPPITGFVTTIATNLESWFVLAVLAIVWLVVSGRQKTTVGASAKVGAADDTPEIEEQIAQVVKYFEGLLESRRLSEKGSFEAIWNDLNVQRKNLLTPEFLAGLDARLAQMQRDIANNDAGRRHDLLQFMSSSHELAGTAQNLNLEFASNIKSVSDAVKMIELDLLYLLHFSVNSTTVRFLDWLISQSREVKNRVDIPRLELCERAEGYIRAVRGQLAGTFRGMEANVVLGNAENEAVAMLSGIPVGQWPGHISPLDLRRYVIAETQHLRLTAFLQLERDQVIATLTNSRDDLLERLRLREPKKDANP